jgi:hypothetical protein
MAQQTAVRKLINYITERGFDLEYEMEMSFLDIEKEQSIGLIKQTAMFMAAANYDKDIAKMSHEDVYNSYYNETYNK